MVITVLLIAGCNVEEENLDGYSNYFMTFKVDGSIVEFRNTGVGGVANGPIYNSRVHSFALSGTKFIYSQEESDLFFLSFIQESPELELNHDYVIDYTSITGDYENEILDRAIALVGFITYYIDPNGVQFTAIPIHDFEYFNRQTGYSVKFTSISSDAVEGMFSAILYNQELDKLVNITEGKFRLVNVLNRN
ncbi:hypothetical protein [Algoriphagus sp. NG3]|uniref:hypothetical protein n=1 Tax=unclassified Algoriphagus TaxID=2641541 RepID=UPI002A80CBBA|nr:hypothetical protein [Algoriphagus sp. NG3]WPR76354.1 hypothetical protein SLW71_03210 [Algoriphagus sp. NG3]